MDDRVARRVAGRLNGLSQKFCVMMIGLPGSGKTTFRKQLVSALENPVMIVSTDDIVQEWAEREGMTYSEAFGKMDLDFNSEAHRQTVYATGNNFSLIMDQTNATPRSRARKLAWIPKGYYTVGVFCQVNEDETYRRLIKRGASGASVDVYLGMKTTFAEPSAQEFDELYRVEYHDHYLQPTSLSAIQ